MNINLISPENQGSDFKTYFKNPISIPANSKVYLNHTALSRHTDIELSEDANFDILLATEGYDTSQETYMNVLPCVLATDGTTLNDPFDELEDDRDDRENHFTIPKGKYTLYQIWFAIQKGINTILGNVTDAPFDMYRFIRPSDMKRVNDWKGNDADINQENTRFSLGLVWDIVGNVSEGVRAFTSQPFDADTSHFVNSGDGGRVGGYFKTNANNPSADGSRLNFDNYAIGDKAFHWMGTNDDYTPIINKNILYAYTSQTYQEIIDTDNCLIMGLYGKQYAEGIYGADGAFPQDFTQRTRGTGAVNGAFKNPQQFPQDYTDNSIAREFASFIQISIDGRGVGGNVELSVKVAKNTIGNGNLRNWNNQNQAIEEMEVLPKGDRINLRHAMGADADDRIQIGIQTYYDYGDKWNRTTRPTGNKMTRIPNIYFRVINMSGIMNDSIAEDPSLVIYDSKSDNCFFPEAFFVANQSGTPAADSIDYTRNSAVSVRSQVGLYPIASSLVQDTGFSRIDYPQLEDDEFIMPTYRFSTKSRELYNYLNFNEYEYSQDVHNIDKTLESTGKAGFSRWLHPNHFDPSSRDLSHIEDLTLDWKNDSYSILLNGLPLKNLKNTENNNRGGYEKAILANIPTPFTNSTDFDIGQGVLTTATYEPNFKSFSNLYNQKTTINNLNIQIIKQKTDKPATEILRSIVNFTIEPPETFSANLNTA